MKTEEFNKCRQFLEEQLSNNLDNKELIAAYVKLIESKSQYDTATDKAIIEKEIREAELNTQFRTTAYANDTDLNKAIHRNNIDYSMAWNTQQAESYRHYQSMQANVFNHAVGHGYQPWIQLGQGQLPQQPGGYSSQLVPG
jgi:hypothetical protein